MLVVSCTEVACYWAHWESLLTHKSVNGSEFGYLNKSQGLCPSAFTFIQPLYLPLSLAMRVSSISHRPSHFSCQYLIYYSSNKNCIDLTKSRPHTSFLYTHTHTHTLVRTHQVKIDNCGPFGVPFKLYLLIIPCQWRPFVCSQERSRRWPSENTGYLHIRVLRDFNTLSTFTQPQMHLSVLFRKLNTVLFIHSSGMTESDKCIQ